jgi:phosphomannomutase
MLVFQDLWFIIWLWIPDWFRNWRDWFGIINDTNSWNRRSFRTDGELFLLPPHNPKQWNALKLLNDKGEFLNGIEGEKILAIAEAEAFDFADVDSLGEITENDAYMDIHIDEVI